MNPYFLLPSETVLLLSTVTTLPDFVSSLASPSSGRKGNFLSLISVWTNPIVTDLKPSTHVDRTTRKNIGGPDVTAFECISQCNNTQRKLLASKT